MDVANVGVVQYDDGDDGYGCDDGGDDGDGDDGCGKDWDGDGGAGDLDDDEFRC